MQLISARGAQKTKDGSKKLQGYSKQWMPGDTLRVFYPIFWNEGSPEIAVGPVWGFPVNNVKELGLGTIFIPSTNEFDIDEGVPKGIPDITYQFSLLAPVFVNGQRAREEAEVASRNYPSESVRKTALAQIEEKYDTKNNQDAVKPIIGRATYRITTEVLSVKIANGVPVTDTLALSSAALSGQLIQKLYTILDDPKYCPEEGADFIEIEWKYPVNTNKGESGKAANPAGLTPEYRLENQFPEAYKIVSGMFNSVSKDADTIKRRANRSVDVAKVRAALTNYSFLHANDLDTYTEEDEDRLLKNVGLIKDLGIVSSLSNEELVEKINNAIMEMEAVAAMIPVDVPTPEIPPQPENAVNQDVSEAVIGEPELDPEAPKMDDLLAQDVTDLGGHPNIQNLISNPHFDKNENLDDVDLTSVV